MLTKLNMFQTDNDNGRKKQMWQIQTFHKEGAGQRVAQDCVILTDTTDN